MNFQYLWALTVAATMVACAAPTSPASPAEADHMVQLRQLLPADAILLGEQHDAPEHQRIHRLAVQTLAAQHTLAALALEMASQGQSTEALSADADEDQVRAALQWDNAGWPWSAYGPVVMTAVRAGVPVVGANLARARLRETMTDAGYDRLLGGPALKTQQQNVRIGHCELLPESQITPMTRVQIARDVAMAQTLLRLARSGKTVLLLAGGAHVDRNLGVAQHLPPDFKSKTVLLLADKGDYAINIAANYDQVWLTEPTPPVDHCARFSAQRQAPGAPSPRESTP